MLGIIILLGLSFIFTFLIYKNIWDVLGIIPNQKRVAFFTLGFLLVAILAISNKSIEGYIASIEWKTNEDFTLRLMAKAAWFYFISALTEELIFRGVLLKILSEKIKPKNAVLLSAVCFGCYHWFSYNMFGAGIVPILYVFIITGFAGYVWGNAFIKSKTIWLPVGMHFSWNFSNALYPGSGPYNSLLFVETGRTAFSEIDNLFLALFTGIFPTIIMYLGLRLFFKDKFKLSKIKINETNDIIN